MNEVWVGKHRSSNAMFVFEPVLEGRAVLIYSSLKGELLQCSKDQAQIIRNSCLPVSEAVHAELIISYRVCMDRYDTEQKEQLRVKAADLEKKTRLVFERLRERHRLFLLNKGKEYKGIQRASTYRSSGCWFCKSYINNFTRLECLSCRGIICSCGACLCGWSPLLPRSSE